MPAEWQLRRDICDIGRRIYEHGFVAATDGNLSVRVMGDRMFITPSGSCLGELRPADLVYMDFDRRVLAGPRNPSSELALHVAVYRARRYRLTRTVFRGIRCHQGGSALRYAACAMVWWTLIIVTLGLAYPFAQASLERFKMRHTHYGNLAGRFEASGVRLFLRGLPMWLLVIGPFAGALIFPLATVEWDRVFAAAATASSVENFLGQLEGGFPAVYTAIVVARYAELRMPARSWPVVGVLVTRSRLEPRVHSRSSGYRDSASQNDESCSRPRSVSP